MYNEAISPRVCKLNSRKMAFKKRLISRMNDKIETKISSGAFTEKDGLKAATRDECMLNMRLIPPSA